MATGFLVPNGAVKKNEHRRVYVQSLVIHVSIDFFVDRPEKFSNER